MDAEKKPWERLAGEGPKAYAAFRRFRDLGLGRTLVGCRSIEHRWSWKWKWRERAEAWDDEWCRCHDQAALNGRPPPVLEEPIKEPTPVIPLRRRRQHTRAASDRRPASGSDEPDALVRQGQDDLSELLHQLEGQDDLSELLRQLERDNPWTETLRSLTENP